jgi:DNA-directed RNA polymerase subunit B
LVFWFSQNYDGVAESDRMKELLDLKEQDYVEQIINSYNYFLENGINKIVEENKLIIPKTEDVRIELQKLEITKPMITEADGSPRKEFYPMEARLRNRNYSGQIFLDMVLYRRNVEQDSKTINIGEMPIMLKSKKCWLHGLTDEELIDVGEDPLDFGGYFIINGVEKALITQESIVPNRVLLSKEPTGTLAEVISTKGAFRGKVRISRSNDGILYVTFPASPRKMRLFVLLKALGMKGQQEIMEAFSDVQEVRNDVLLNLEQTDVKTQQDALDTIGKYVAPGQLLDYRLRRAQEVMDNYLLPHIGQSQNDRIAKAFYLITMAEKVIEYAVGLRGEDDKDHYMNKRLELAGKLMEHLFRYSFKYFVRDIKFQIDRTVARRRKLNIATIIRPGALTEKIMSSMATGTWVNNATGVSKYLERENFIATLTDIRRLKSPLDTSKEVYEARDVHGTYWGRICPIETPDGPPAGLVKNLAVLAEVTTDVDTKEVEKVLKKMGVAFRK